MGLVRGMGVFLTGTRGGGGLWDGISLVRVWDRVCGGIVG